MRGLSGLEGIGMIRFLPVFLVCCSLRCGWRARILVYGMPSEKASTLLLLPHLESFNSSKASGLLTSYSILRGHLLVLGQNWEMGVRLLGFYCCCLLFSLPFHGLVTVEAFTGTYGINYGRLADNLPPPETVVKLLKLAKLKNVRIFDSDPSVLNAFKGSGLELYISIPNGLVKDISVNEVRAMDWIKENVQPYLPDTQIRGIAVGNEVLGGADVGLAEALFGAVKNVYTALNRLQLTNLIEVSTPHSEGVFASSYPPSNGTFKADVFVYLKPMLDFFSQTGTPFYINVYPFLAYKDDPEHIDINYALFKKNDGIYDAKNDLHYDNMFDAQIDATYVALIAAGYGNMEVRVSETGWASSGDANEAGASVQNARTYNLNLKKRLFKKKGTPLRPKTPVKAYIFALFNEDSKTGPTSERHFGLYKPDGSISYDIGFPGLKSSASSSFLFLKEIQAGGWSSPYSLVLITCSAVLLALIT